MSNENTHFAVGWCLDIHDVAVAKLIAGRQKDIDFIENLLRLQLANPETIRKRLDQVANLDSRIRNLAEGFLDQSILNATHHRLPKLGL